jgi:hypothetical protein
MHTLLCREYLLQTNPQSHSSEAQSFFCVIIRLLREPLTPKMLPRLQALSPNLLLRRLVASSDPSDSESSLHIAALNKKLVPNLDLASVTTQSHTIVSDIESMREMALFTPSDPETHWHDRFRSLRPPFPYTKFHAHSDVAVVDERFPNAGVPTPAAQESILSDYDPCSEPPKTIGELTDEVERIREDLFCLQRDLEKLEIVETALFGDERKEA